MDTRPAAVVASPVRVALRLCLVFALLHLCGCPSQGRVVALDAGVVPKNLVEALTAAALKMPDERRRVQLYTEVASAYLVHSDTVRATALINTSASMAQSIDSVAERDQAVARVVRVLIAAGRVADAAKLAAALPASPDRAELYAEMANGAAKAGDEALADDMITSVGSATGQGAARVRVAQVLARRGATSRALRLGKTLPDARNRNALLLAVAEAYVRRNRFRKALGLTQYMESGLEKSRTFAAIAIAHSRKGRNRDALAIARRIESEWIRARTYASMSTLTRRKKRARKYAAKALSLATGVADTSLRATVFEDIADVYIAADRVKAVVDLADRTPDAGSRKKILAHLAVAQARRKRFTSAQTHLAAVEADVVWAAEAASALAIAYAKAGRYSEALALMARIRVLELRLSPLARVAVIHARANAKVTAELDALVRKSLVD